ncbi:alkaline phosphatase, tissue-nonspecific isozyme-like [Acanthaster planci]|uniref:Alkaline phosphatase n=1 Tax=Acanthaster planci TaxID=133434 RepID=A0A8B7XY76_ACAPL|nr:alkaline phosphatase, tissue-nonspecific isozyme-like [Acanthaster planci]
MSLATDYPEHWRRQAYESLHKALDDAKQNKKIAHNVIMFLGDGMSISTVVSTRILKGQNAGNPGEETVLSYEAFPHIGLSKTYNTDHQVPDSAGTATAYLTGVKTKKGVIGLDGRALYRNCDTAAGREVSSILKVAKEAGMAVGFVTTTRITHASPAGLYAHVPYRHWEHDTDGTSCDDIAKQFVRSEMDIDVALGGGWREFRPTSYIEGGSSGKREDSLDLIQEWEARYKSKGNAKYITKLDELQNLDVQGTDYVLGLFNADHIDYEADNVAGQPTVAEMTEQAIRLLSRGGRRYFLFVEGGRIDHAHHVNVAHLALTESLGMEKAVEKSLELTKGTDTLTVVTSDHSHTLTITGYPVRGNPILGYNQQKSDIIFSDGLPYTTLNYGIGPGGFEVQKSFKENSHRPDPSKTDTQAPHYMQSALIAAVPGAHAGDDVAIFAHGPMSHLFHSVHEQNYIMHAMQYAACIGDFAPNCH